MTKILFTLGWKDDIKSVYNYYPTFELVRGLSALGQDVHLLAPDNIEMPECAHSPDAERWLRLIPNDYRTHMGFSRNMAAYLRKEESYDIYHTNGLNNHLNHLTCATARRLDRPYLITPYGMLYDYHSWRKQKFSYSVYRRVFFNNDIRYASCLRATSEDEARRLREIGFKNPIAFIPWPNEIPDYIDQVVEAGKKWKEENSDRRRIAGVLVDTPDGSLLRMINAFTEVAEPTDELVLVDMGYIASAEPIKRFVKERNLKNVKVMERRNEYDTSVMIATCSATVIPGHHLYVGPIVARSLLCLTPIIIAQNPEWEVVPEMKCGWWCPPGDNLLQRLIATALLMDPQLLLEKGRNGRKLVESTYSTQAVATKMVRLYDWLLGKASRPEFVI